MKKFLLLLLPALFCLSLRPTETPKEPLKVLIFSKTMGFRHKSIDDGIRAIKKLGAENGFIADTTENSDRINKENLKNYKAIIFLSPTGEFFNDEQRSAFQSYIRRGGGFVGIHAATDCLFKWEWYGKMIGAYFTDHPATQDAIINVVNTKHLATKDLSSPWKRKDEWYNLRYTNPDVKVLLKIDETSYKGGKNGDNHAISWYHKFEGGRVFYTGLGHTSESFNSDKDFLNHLLGGIKYALDIK
ncbi:ThuA domain-containing protein [Paradesertivirga mongoliensis]|uniref:ThuA domain-containing protein n=1 Tax=Paradesertivirga mongoliensis TaxID=2100740 RepID=A0ABW4ZNR6_9SPHI|nr:ThuA domain-containing protein [Pedobacter mongoliensis]